MAPERRVRMKKPNPIKELQLFPHPLHVDSAKKTKLNICEAIHPEKVIWKTGRPTDATRITRAWKSVSAKVQCPVGACKKHYKSIKTSFSSKIRKIMNDKPNQKHTFSSICQYILDGAKNRAGGGVYLWSKLLWLVEETFKEELRARCRTRTETVDGEALNAEPGAGIEKESEKAPATKKRCFGVQNPQPKNKTPQTPFIAGVQDADAPALLLDFNDIKEEVVDAEEEQRYLMQGPPVYPTSFVSGLQEQAQRNPPEVASTLRNRDGGSGAQQDPPLPIDIENIINARVKIEVEKQNRISRRGDLFSALLDNFRDMPPALMIKVLKTVLQKVEK